MVEKPCRAVDRCSNNRFGLLADWILVYVVVRDQIGDRGTPVLLEVEAFVVAIHDEVQDLTILSR